MRTNFIKIHVPIVTPFSLILSISDNKYLSTLIIFLEISFPNKLVMNIFLIRHVLHTHNTLCKTVTPKLTSTKNETIKSFADN